MRAVKKEYEGRKKTRVKRENDKSYKNPSSRKHVVRGDAAVSSKKIVFVKKEPCRIAKTRTGLHRRGTCQIRYVLCDRCLRSNRNSDGRKYLKGEGNSLTVHREVEILESDVVMKKGILSHFVPSQILHKSMLDTKSHLQTASDVFRKEVLKVMSRPYDKEEHQRCREVMRVGSYLDHYPVLRRELVKYRYNRGKRLVILRGFLYWLQNVSRGVFRPWEDEECLAVELK